MRVPVVFTLLALAAAPATAQDKAFCFQAKPKPACAAFSLTNGGAAFVIGVRTNSGETPLRGIVDWGAMVNVSTRDAVGGSVLASLDEAGLGIGPAVRYRRWLTQQASFDLAIALPVLTTEDDGRLRPGSILGLVRWNPVSWFGVAVRPELLQRRVLVGPGCCEYGTESAGRVSVGLEAGEWPGVVVSSAAGVALVVVILLVVGAGS